MKVRPDLYMSISFCAVVTVLIFIITPFAVYCNRVCTGRYDNPTISVTLNICGMPDPGRTAIIYFASALIVFLFSFALSFFISSRCFGRCIFCSQRKKFVNNIFISTNDNAAATSNKNETLPILKPADVTTAQFV